MAILDTDVGTFVGSAQFCEKMYEKAKQIAEQAQERESKAAQAAEEKRIGEEWKRLPFYIKWLYAVSRTKFRGTSTN